MEITEKEVARQITELINKNVKQLESQDEKWENHYKSIMEDLEFEIINTKSCIEDFEDGLPINKIEQEGYLRALKTVVNRFRDLEKHI